MDVSPVSDKEQSGDECILLYNRRKKVQGHKTIISSDSEKSDSVEIQSEQRPETASVLQSAQRPETASVQVATSNNTKTKRIWDKRNVCVYCKGSFSKLPRHMEQKHKQELEVSLALSYPKGSPRRKIQWRKLQNKGNFSHNREVLLNKTGLLIPYKRPSARSTAEAPDYLPCPDCFGLFKRKDLWRHAKKCTLRKEKKNMKASTKRPQAAAAALIPLCNDVDKNYKKHIIDNLQSDKIALLIRNDPVILEFGGRLYMKCASKPHQHSYVRQKVRELGRFVTEMRETNTAVSSLADCLQPKLFKDVIQAVKKTSKFDENTLEYEIPSLALKLGHSLKKCADIAKSKALIEGDNRKKQEMSDFLELMNTDWNTAISAQALTTLSTRKLNSPQRLPLAEDIKRLNEFLEKKSIELETNLSEGKFDCWRQYAEIILAHIVLFNRRRGGETERMELKQYNDGIQTASSGDMREEVFRSLSDFERSLANTMHRIEIVGKKGRHVAVLLTKQQKKRIDTLNRLRRQAGVDEENKYVFARFGDSLSPVRSSDVLRKYAQMCGASKPELITSTLLRKHVATISQILSLKNNEMDALATFLGHDIRVHREYYRLPDSTYQLAKISKILLGLEKGTIQTMKGRSLDEIQMNSDGEFYSLSKSAPVKTRAFEL